MRYRTMRSASHIPLLNLENNNCIVVRMVQTPVFRVAYGLGHSYQLQSQHRIVWTTVSDQSHYYYKADIPDRGIRQQYTY